MSTFRSLFSRHKPNKEEARYPVPDLGELRKTLGVANNDSHIYPSLAPQDSDVLVHPSLPSHDSSPNYPSYGIATLIHPQRTTSLSKITEQEIGGPELLVLPLPTPPFIQRNNSARRRGQTSPGPQTGTLEKVYKRRSKSLSALESTSTPLHLQSHSYLNNVPMFTQIPNSIHSPAWTLGEGNMPSSPVGGARTVTGPGTVAKSNLDTLSPGTPLLSGLEATNRSGQFQQRAGMIRPVLSEENLSENRNEVEVCKDIHLVSDFPEHSESEISDTSSNGHKNAMRPVLAIDPILFSNPAMSYVPSKDGFSEYDYTAAADQVVYHARNLINKHISSLEQEEQRPSRELKRQGSEISELSTSSRITAQKVEGKTSETISEDSHSAAILDAMVQEDSPVLARPQQHIAQPSTTIHLPPKATKTTPKKLIKAPRRRKKSASKNSDTDTQESRYDEIVHPLFYKFPSPQKASTDGLTKDLYQAAFEHKPLLPVKSPNTAFPSNDRSDAIEPEDSELAVAGSSVFSCSPPGRGIAVSQFEGVYLAENLYQRTVMGSDEEAIMRRISSVPTSPHEHKGFSSSTEVSTNSPIPKLSRPGLGRSRSDFLPGQPKSVFETAHQSELEPETDEELSDSTVKPTRPYTAPAKESKLDTNNFACAPGSVVPFQDQGLEKGEEYEGELRNLEGWSDDSEDECDVDGDPFILDTELEKLHERELE